jgi:hypothetical protein
VQAQVGIVYFQRRMAVLAGACGLAGSGYRWFRPLASPVAAQGYFGPRVAGHFLK